MLKLMTTDNNLSQPTDVAALVASAPLLELLDRVTNAIQTLRQLAPNAPEVAAYERLHAWLHDAIETADRSEVWVSTREAAERLGLSVSHVQHLCALEKEERPFRARKMGGTWRIDASSLRPTGTGTRKVGQGAA